MQCNITEKNHLVNEVFHCYTLSVNDWQYQLRSERRTDVNPEPVDHVSTRLSAQLPTVAVVTEQFNYLLRQLPMMKRVDNPYAKEQYLVELSAALGEIYYLRARIAKLDDHLSSAEREAAVHSLLEEYGSYVQQFRIWVMGETYDSK